MAWVGPRFSRAQVDWAGGIITNSSPSESNLNLALGIVNNWRSAHSFPLNTFQVGLRSRAKGVDRSFLVAQRIKRLSSIRSKLQRFQTMKLSQMQDIGGCRAVVSDSSKAYALRRAYKKSRLKHRLVREDDYIANPKESGYRSIHLVYRYFSDRKTTYNKLQVELQLRSKLQHSWATAVETVGTFLEQSLKASQGTPAWLRFFSLMGSVIALRENTPPVPGTPRSKDELTADVRRLDNELGVRAKLRAYGQALNQVEEDVSDARYYLLDLSPSRETVTITGFGARELEEATSRYLEVERALIGPGSEAVLVSVDSLSSLRAAYPNYFLDTNYFLDLVTETLS